MGDKWTLLIVRDLAAGPRRFVELQRVLPGISTEQLRSRLNRMVADGMLTRRRFREVPPRVEYQLTERSRDLLPALGELARWGYTWAWSAPRSGEQVDIDAIFRLAPGLVKPPPGVRGTVELRVEHEQGAAAVLVEIEDGAVTVRDASGEEQPDARLSAPVAAWVRALLPVSDRAGLRIEGDRALAEQLLAALAPEQSAQAERSRSIGSARAARSA